jgi:mitochondrial fission protein ELM1
MLSSARIAPLSDEVVPLRDADATGGAVPPLRAGVWPRHIAFPLAAFLLFLGVAVAIARAHGIPFVLPTEERSPALGFSGAVPITVAALGYAVTLLLTRKRARGDRRRLVADTLTDLLYLGLFVATTTLYFQLKLWIPLLNPALYDQTFFAVDQQLRPVLDGVVRLRNGIAAGLPVADFWYQGAQLGLFILSFWGLAFRRDRRWHQHNVTALLLNIMIGALAYLIAPAVGPFVFEQGQNAAAAQAQHVMLEVFNDVRTQGVAWLAAHGGEHVTAAPAAMPSLHLSAALIVIYYAARARSALLPLMAAFGGWIALEALAARWHYVVDLPAGALVATASIAATNLAYRWVASPAGDGTRPRRPRLALVRPEPRPTPPKRPLVWAVLCYRAGDNAQIRALAERLGWNVEVKRLAYRPGGRLIDVWRGTNLLGIDRKRSSPLEGPWPDLIISASMRNEPVCRWIKAQSGGRARYVHIGKPWADVSRFDLVISAPEFPVPEAPNVLRTSHTLHGVTRNRLRAEAARWAPRLAHLPRPYIAVLLGGYGGPYALVPGNAARLGAEASAMARRLGGSLLITTSARTPRRATDALLAAVDAPHELFRWAPDAPENPYFGYLSLADAVIVTCDSTSMLAEACATGKPVYMFDLARDGASVADRLANWLEPDWIKAFLYQKLVWGLAPKKVTRDIRVVHRHLLDTGRVAWLGEPAPSGPPLGDEMARAAARVRDLLAPVEADEMRLTGS